MAIDVGGGQGKKKGRAVPDMNVTPLVDVVLVLLIIFMVITPIVNAHFWVHIPDKPDPTEEVPPPDPSDKKPIVVTVNAKGEIQINKTVIPDEEFPLVLKRALVASGERRIFFDAEDEAPYARAVEALDLSRGAGAAHIALMTQALK